MDTRKDIHIAAEKIGAAFLRCRPSVRKLMAALFAVTVIFMISKMGTSFRSDYPVMERLAHIENPELVDYNDLFIEEFALLCDYMVLGTVKSFESIEPNPFFRVPAVAKMEFIVESRLKGQIPKKKITVWFRQSSVDVCPQFKKGDRLIIQLMDKIYPKEIEGSENDYDIASSYTGIFYVSRDDKVYPIRLTEAMEPISGESLSKVKSRIKYGMNMQYHVDKMDEAMLKKLYPGHKFDWLSYWRKNTYRREWFFDEKNH